MCVLQTIPAVLVQSATVLTDLAADFSVESLLSEGNERLIGPGTDRGLYNEGFFEGDIYRKRFRVCYFIFFFFF